MRQKPKITPALASDLLFEKHSGMSSEQTTATIAPAEKASAQGIKPTINVAAIAPKRQAGISTAPEPCEKRNAFKGLIPLARSGNATHMPSGKFCTAIPTAKSTADNSAPAPPIAAKYTPVLRFIASRTSSLISPLPIIPPKPISRRVGAKLSILAEVVGPQLPEAIPGFAGHGPA